MSDDINHAGYNFMENSLLGEFNLSREQMVPKFNESKDIQILNPSELVATEKLIYEDKNNWEELIQAGNYKLTADTEKYSFLYKNLVKGLSDHIGCDVKLKTPLDFFLFDKFDKEWEDKPSGFIHNDWGNYSICMREFAKNEDIQYYEPSHAIALVLAITLPNIGSGIELYDAFHGEGVGGKKLLQQRKDKQYSLREYQIGHATMFCPFQFHSGHCADKGTLKSSDTRMVLVAFLVKYKKDDIDEWHMFRMCKGATLEYGDEKLYGLPEEILKR